MRDRERKHKGSQALNSIEWSLSIAGQGAIYSSTFVEDPCHRPKLMNEKLRDEDRENMKKTRERETLSK